MVKVLGNVNARVATVAKWRGGTFVHDGTTKGLVLSAIARGAKPGDEVIVDKDFSSTRVRIVHAAHDERAGGFWAERVW